MPKATIYIREEDWEQWQAIKSSPDFVDRLHAFIVGDYTPTTAESKPAYTTMQPNTFDRRIGKCGHGLNDQNKCTTKKCTMAGKVQ